MATTSWLGFAYLLATSYFVINWFKFFKKNPSSSPEEVFLSLVILVITIVLWPLVIPMHLRKLIKTKKVVKIQNFINKLAGFVLLPLSVLLIYSLDIK